MKLFNYDDQKVELSLLPKCSLLMAYLMIWQGKKQVYK